MADDFVAKTQHNDLTGTVALDGVNSGPLYDLMAKTNMTTEFYPVGVSFSDVRADHGDIPFVLVAVRKQEASESLESMTEYVRSHRHLKVYEFEGTLNAHDLKRVFKMLSIKPALSA